VVLAVPSAAGGAVIANGLSGGNLSQTLKAGLIAGVTAFAFFQVGSATNAIASVNPDAPHITPGLDTTGAYDADLRLHSRQGVSGIDFRSPLAGFPG
jgi:hypothetical protein